MLEENENESENVIDDKWADKSVAAQPVASESASESNDELDNSAILDLVLSKDEDELLPWETVVLPSKGLYYEDSVPGGVVEVRPMNIYVEKIMSTQRFVKSGKAIDMVFKHCVRFPDPNFDSLDLLSGDGTFLLFYLRGITFGNMYEFFVTCSNEDCQHGMTKSFDLNELQHTIQWANPDIGSEPFRCDLPYMTKFVKRPFYVGVRLIRRRDMLAMTNNVTSKHKSHMKPAHIRKRKMNNITDVQSANDIIERNLNQVIVSAMDNADSHKVQQLVSRMHSTDSATVREFLNDVSPGIDTMIEVECPECDEVMSIGLPLTESFFRPTKPGGNRT